MQLLPWQALYVTIIVILIIPQTCSVDYFITETFVRNSKISDVFILRVDFVCEKELIQLSLFIGKRVLGNSAVMRSAGHHTDANC